MKRSAVAVWNGTIQQGHGKLSTQSGVLEEAQYSFKSRFSDGIGTNPEELIAAAHAGCFAMKLSLDLSDAGFSPSSIQVSSLVEIESGEITSSHLTLTAVIPGIDPEKFAALAESAKQTCPVSKALSITISMDASLA